MESEPNDAHKLIATLQDTFVVDVITQNVDNLHERAGSKSVLHLHGELMKSRSTLDDKLVYDISGWELKKGDKCERGSQLRPHIVWFGEAVPMMTPATKITAEADIFCVVGTSLAVYPAASLIHYVPQHCKVFLIDPNPSVQHDSRIVIIKEKATVGVRKFLEIINQTK